jgi:16S rRNA (guanine966-N2)-methyltransferase
LWKEHGKEQSNIVYCYAMRIIAGTKRGMNLFSPEGKVSRPITDRVKESLFNVLYKYNLPAGAVIADIFCGVGSLGLEALSRGAEFVTFIERDIKIASVLKKNISKAGFNECSRILNTDAFKVVDKIDDSDRRKCNLIFVDPPYVQTSRNDENSKMAGLINSLPGQLSPGGIVILRTASTTILSEQYGQLKMLERRQWGTMACNFYSEAGK